MRRKEFEITDRSAIERFLASQSSGVITLSASTPYSLPVNFAWDGSRIIIHSALEGKKVPLLRAGNRGQFTVHKEYSVIPSFFSQSREACNATQFFASAMVFGPTGEIIDLKEKAAALNAIMDQIQGKGTYPKISADDAKAAAMLTHVGIFFLKAESMSAKFKAGQNLSDERAEEIIESLLNRGTPLDIETVEFMRQLRPEKK